MKNYHIIVLPILLGCSRAVELTFELPDSAKECFFEVIPEGTESTVEYQVSLPCCDMTFTIYLQYHFCSRLLREGIMM